MMVHATVDKHLRHLVLMSYPQVHIAKSIHRGWGEGNLTRAQVGCLLVSLLLAMGCDTGPPEYPVSGVVEYNGVAVPTGWVLFKSADHGQTSAAIDPEGHYETLLPAGKYMIGVSAPRKSSAVGMDTFEEGPLPPHVPIRFSLPDKTGIVLTVEQKEANPFDIEIKERQR